MWIPGQRFVDLYVYVTTVSIWVSRVVLLVKNLPANELHITDVGFDLWVRKIPWKRAWQPSPVFLPGESPWTEEPGELQSMELQSWTWLKKLSTQHSVHMSSLQLSLWVYVRKWGGERERVIERAGTFSPALSWPGTHPLVRPLSPLHHVSGYYRGRGPAPGPVPDSLGHRGLGDWGDGRLGLGEVLLYPRALWFPSNSAGVSPGQQHHAGSLPASTAGPREEELREGSISFSLIEL